MNKQSYLEIREDLKYVYSLTNNLINDYEMQKRNQQKCLASDEIISNLADISSLLQIDIHRLDMLLSINNIQSQNEG